MEERKKTFVGLASTCQKGDVFKKKKKNLPGGHNGGAEKKKTPRKDKQKMPKLVEKF